MAIFNPDQSPQSPDNTSDSKGVKANTAFADLFGAAGEIGVAAVQVADQNNLINIQKEVNNEVDQVNNEWGTQASAFETSLNPQNTQPLPGDLQRYGKNLNDVRKAYLAGSLKDSNYQMRIDSLSRQIRARYPGYREQIDGIIQKTLGLSTANDLRKSLMAEWNAEQGNISDAQKAYDSFVRKAREDGVLPPQWDAKNSAGQPYSEAETKAYVAAQYQMNADVARQKSLYDLQGKASDANLAQLNEIAQGDMARTSQKVFEGAFSIGGMTMGELQRKVNQGLVKPWSDEENAQLTAAFAEMSSTLETQLWAKVNDPFYNKLNPAQKKALVGQGMEQMKIIENQIKDQQVGLLNFSKTLNETTTQDGLRNWGKDPVVQNFNILKKFTDGTDILNDILLRNPEMSSKLNTALLGLMSGKVLDTNEKSLQGIIQGAKDKQGGQLAPEVIKQTVKNAAQVLLKKDVSLEAAQQAAQVLFSEENQGFLGDFTQKSQTMLFDTLVSPRMTERIQELAKSDPQIGINYRNWALNSFTSLFNQDIDTINDINQYSDNLQIKWNAAKGQFDTGIADFASSRARPVGMDIVNTLNQMYQSWASSNAKESVDNLNKYITKLKPIIEAEGGTVEEAMTALFEANGVGKTKNVGSLYHRLYQAIATGNIDPETGQARPAGANRAEAYKKAVNAPAAELQEFDLDQTGSGKLGANSKLKETIRKAEGTTQSYNTRFGGASDVELSLYDVGDVRDMAKIFGKKSGSSAIGAYQFMPDTINRLVKLGVIKEDDRFTPELQEKMADYLIAEALQGSKGRDDGAKRLAKVWAGLPQGPDGSSAMAGVGLNPSKAQISWDEFMAAF